MLPLEFESELGLSSLGVSAFSFSAVSGDTILGAGSAAFIQYQRDDGPIWSIVLLEDIAAGTVFSFTDAGWKTDGTFRSNESDGLTFTAGQALTAGTAITFTNTDAVLTGTTTSVGTMSGDPIYLQGSGDQLFMYQGSFDGSTGVVSPDFRFITAYHANGAWDAEADGSQTSTLPAELADYSVDQSILGEEQNAVYRGPKSGSPGQIWDYIQNQANWYGDTNPQDLTYVNAVSLLGDFNLQDFNTAPTLTVPTDLLFEVDSVDNVISGISVDDIDGDRMTLTIEVEGTITLASTDGLVFIQGDGTDDSIIEISGFKAAINAALDGLLYTPAPGDGDGDAISLSLTDGESVILPGTFPGTIDLSTLDGTNGFSISGLAMRDSLGYDVGLAGDVNGDGFDDIIIGAPYSENGALVDAGAAYVIYGTPAGFSASFDLNSINGTNGIKITSSTAGDEVGHSVNGVGDVNGDGIDDFGVASFNADVGTVKDAAQSWIIFGNASGLPPVIDVDTLDGTNGFAINGIMPDDYAGRVVTAAGDINGDGIGDILITGDRVDSPGQNAGAAYIVYGTDQGYSAEFNLADINGTNGTVIRAASAGDRLGRMADLAGDINGDGYDDIILGAYERDADGKINAGSAFVVFGGAGGLGAQLDLATLDGTNGFSVDGLAPDDKTGRGVAGAGDLNGDGFDDIVIGAPYADEAGTDGGKAYVVYGSSMGFPANLDVANITGTNGFTIIAEAANQQVGYDVKSLGDINGDGIDDLLIGARALNGATATGSYVLFGSAQGFASTIYLADLDGTNGFKLPDVVGGDRTGFSVSSAGDLNADGINDLLIGANGSDPNGTNSGTVYVVYGDADITQTLVEQTVGIELEYAPTLGDLDGDAVTFTEGDAPIALDAGTALSISDLDSADFDGGRLAIAFASGQESEDRLVIDTSGTVALSAGQTAGSEVSVGGTVIGTLDTGATGGAGEGLVVLLNASATPALVQALLAAIGYDNAGGDTPIAGLRSLEITLEDGDGGDTTVSTSVDVVAVDDAPTQGVPGAQSFAVNSAGNAIAGLTLGDVDSASVTVTLSAEGAITLAQTTGISFDAGADGSSAMTISGSVADVQAAIATLGYAPAADDRDGDTLSVSVSDGTTTVADTVAIALNNTDPVAQDDALGASEDGPALTGSVFADNGNGADSDANGDTLSVTHVNGSDTDVGTQVTLASGALLTLNSDGTFSYDPNGAFEDLDETETAIETITYDIGDGFGGTASATLTITVQGVNDASGLVVPAAQSFAVNSAANAIAGLSVSDVDETDVTVTLSAEGAITLADTTGLTFTTGDGADDATMTFTGTLASVNAAIASLAYTPANGDRDGDAISVTVDDGTETTVNSIAISLTNTDPVAADDAASTDESTVLTGDLFADNGNGLDTDANGDTLTVTEIDSQPLQDGVAVTLASGALLTVNADGTFSYDPNGAFDSLTTGDTATETFTYTVSDGFGGTSTATATLTINGENEAPVTQDDAFSTAESAAISGDLLADNGNGLDTDANGDTLTVTEIDSQPLQDGIAVTLASGALLTVNADGTFSYDPNGAFDSLTTGDTATETFTYTVSDGNGGVSTATATITINGENTPPAAADDAIAAGEDDVAVVGNLLADNGSGPDSDVNGDTLSVTEIDGQSASVGSQVMLASGALLTVNSDGSFSYEPNGAFEALAEGETAVDSVAYTISDGNGGTSSATATFTVTGANDAAGLTLPGGQSVSVNSTGNAIAGLAVSDVDTDTLTVTLSAEGSLTLAQTTGLTFTAGDGAGDSAMTFSGTIADINAALATLGYDPATGDRDGDTVSVTLDDGFDLTNGEIAITQTNDGPVAEDDAFGIGEDGPAASGNLFADNGNGVDSDANGDALTVTQLNGSALASGTSVLLASGARLTLNSDGTFDYDTNGAFESLAPGATATDSFTYTVSDGFGGTDTATATLTITGANDAPIVSLPNDPGFQVDDVVTITGLAVSDVDDDVLTVTLTAAGALSLAQTTGLAFILGDGTADATMVFSGSTADINAALASVIYDAPRGEPADRITLAVGDLSAADEAVIAFGTDAQDTVTGTDGSDNLYGYASADTVTGGEGDDLIVGGTGMDTLSGGNGDDTIHMDDEDVFLSAPGVGLDIGGAGRDTLVMDAGSDFITNGLSVYGFEVFRGAELSDSVRGNLGSVDYDLDGGAGDDTLTGNSGDDRLVGGDGNDTLTGFNGNDTIIGGAGSDTISGGGGDDVITMDSSDNFQLAPGVARDIGGDGRDTLVLEAGSSFTTNGLSAYGFEVFRGAELNDSVRGNLANVKYDLDGGAGDDTLTGNGAADELTGGDGNDTLRGGDSNDVLTGGEGDDYLAGDGGRDIMLGGAGNDTIVLGNADYIRDPQSGDILDLGGEGYDTLAMGTGSTFITNGLSVYGFEAFRGSNGNDSVRGNLASIDYDLDGGAGNDALTGNDGADTLTGGLGDDTLDGGHGLDTFVFDASHDGSDTVASFVSGETVELTGFGYADASAAHADFAQVGSDVVFSRDGVTVTFQNAALADVLSGIEVDAPPPMAMALPEPAPAPAADEVFDFSQLSQIEQPQPLDTALFDLDMSSHAPVMAEDGQPAMAEFDTLDTAAPDWFAPLFTFDDFSA